MIYACTESFTYITHFYQEQALEEILTVFLDQTEKILQSPKKTYSRIRGHFLEILMEVLDSNPSEEPRIGNIPLKESAAKISRHKQAKSSDNIKNRLRLASSPDKKVLK